MESRQQTVMLRIGGLVHMGTIRTISRFGAYLVDVPDLEIDTVVEVAVPLASGRFVVTSGNVVNVVTTGTAVRHGVEPGAIIQFRRSTTDEDSEFHAAVAERTSSPRPEIHVGKPTRQISQRQLSELIEQSRPQVFSGSIQELGLPTLMMMLEQQRKSGRLVVENGGTVANFDLVDGRVVTAEWSGVASSPREILMAVLDWEDGTFDLSATAPTTRDPQLSATITELLIDRARLRDEARRTPVS